MVSRAALAGLLNEWESPLIASSATPGGILIGSLSPNVGIQHQLSVSSLHRLPTSKIRRSTPQSINTDPVQTRFDIPNEQLSDAAFISRVTDVVRRKIDELSKMNLQDARLFIKRLSKTFEWPMYVVMKAIFATWEVTKAVAWITRYLGGAFDNYFEDHPVIASAIAVYGVGFTHLLYKHMTG